MLLNIFAWYFWILPLGSAFSSPGFCPEVPASHPQVIWYSNETYRSLAVQPYYFFPRHNFKYISLDGGRKINTYIFPNDSGEACVLLTEEKDRRKGLVSFKLSGINTGLESFINALAPLECNNTKMGVIRVWYDSEFLFLWSCLNDSRIEQKYQTVIVLVKSSSFERLKYQYNHTREYYENQNNFIRSIAQKYIGEELGNRIEVSWTLLFQGLKPLEGDPTAGPVIPSDPGGTPDEPTWKIAVISILLILNVSFVSGILLSLNGESQ